MIIPKRNIGGWATEIINACSASRQERIQRGSVYKNVFLTGDENGDPAIYNKTFAYLDNLSSFLYSPVELRYAISKYGGAGATDRAKFRAAAAFLHEHISGANVDTTIEDAVTWSLVKGKTFIELLWDSSADGGGFAPYLIQPELMGVLREDISDLDRQEAFFKTSYIQPEEFERLVRGHAKEKELLKSVARYMDPGKNADGPDNYNMLKQVILGGLNPYQASSQTDRKKARGVVDWMGGPSPTFSPEILTKIIRLDELWVWDDDRDDWTTIQIVGPDCVVEGEIVHRNVFADAVGTSGDDKCNPLKGHHPFQEICPNRLDGYFWGRSEICNVALLQSSINVRITGINSLLRRQENPPRAFIGGTGINQTAVSKLNKPGGYLADNSPGLKIESLAPDLPADLWSSLHESERMFDEMGGFMPTMRGQGEAGVRSAGHADSLARNASPRFKDRALIVERQIAALGGLGLDILKAKIANKLIAWVPKKEGGVEVELPPTDPFDQPPAPGLAAIEFLLSQLPDGCKVSVDSHSSSPAFSHETRGLMFDLTKAGAVTPEYLLEHTDVPGRDDAIADFQKRAAEKAAFLAQHPEAALKGTRRR